MFMHAHSLNLLSWIWSYVGHGRENQFSQASHTQPETARAMRLEIPRLSLETQMQRVCVVVEAGIGQARRAGDCHRRARRLLDAADYTLLCLVADLHGIVDLPFASPLCPAGVDRTPQIALLSKAAAELEAAALPAALAA